MKPKISLLVFLYACGSALITMTFAHAGNYYWDTDGATPGAGGPVPGGTWATSGTTWSTSPTGILATSPYTTLLADDLFFSAGADAWGSYTASLTSTQNANSLTFQEGNAIISGTGGVITLGGTGNVRVDGGQTATIGNNTSAIIDGSAGLTKLGRGTLTFNGTTQNTFTGGITVNGGTLSVDYANRGNNNQYILATNPLTLGGSGTFNVKGNGVNNSTQTVDGVTINAGGGIITNNPSGGTATINLGAITASAAGGSLQFTRGTGTGTITTTNTNDGSSGGGILSARIVNGVAAEWAINNGSGTIASYAGYTTTLPTSVGSSTTNYSITAGITLAGNLAANTLKIVGSGTALALGGNTLTLTSGGLLSTGSTGQTISGTAAATRLTAGDGLGGTTDLVVHQYNTGGLTISAVIGNNAAGSGNTVNLVKAGTGYLALSGVNTYTGNTYVNGGILDFGATTPSGSGANITVAPGASVRFNAPNQTLLNRIAATTEEFGIMTATGNANALDFTNHPNAFLAGGFATNGAKTDNFTGTITPANNTYRIGFTGAAGSFGFSSTLTGATNGLIVGGNTLVLTNANTHGGETVVRTGANFLLANTLAMQNSALNLGTGSDTVTGLFALSQLRTNLANDKLVTSATLGGLVGSRNLATAYGGAYGNNAGFLSTIAVRGFTLNPGSGASHVYTGQIANFTRDTTLAKTGAGTQELGGNNTYSGVTTISDGVLKIGHAAALGKGGSAGGSAGSTLVESGGTLDLNGVTDVMEPIILNGTGFGGNGALVNNSGTAASIVGGIASVQITSGGTYTGTAPTVSLTGSGTGATATVQLGLSAASLSSFSGGTGWVIGDMFTTSGGTGTGAVFEVSAVTAANPTAWTVVNAGSGYTSAPTGISKLTRTGTATGTLTLSFNTTNNVVAGLTLTNGGSGYDTTTTAGFSAGSAAATVQHSSVVLASDSSVGGSGDITIGAVVSQTGGARSLTKVGAGTLTLTAANTYTGNTLVNTGKITMGNTLALQNSAYDTASVAGGLDVTGFATPTLGGLTGSVNLSSTLITGYSSITELKLNPQTGSTQTYSADIGDGAGGMALTKTGGGTQILSAANSYSGATTVSVGTLYVTGALSNSAVTVQANGTMGSNGAAGTLGNGLTIAAGGNLDLTGATLGLNSTNILSLTGGALTLGNLTFQDLVGWDWENAAPGTYELIDGAFTVNFGSTAFLNEATAYVFGNGNKGYFTQGSLNAVIVIPEPRAALLGGLGLLALLRRRRD